MAEDDGQKSLRTGGLLDLNIICHINQRQFHASTMYLLLSLSCPQPCQISVVSTMFLFFHFIVIALFGSFRVYRWVILLRISKRVASLFNVSLLFHSLAFLAMPSKL